MLPLNKKMQDFLKSVNADAIPKYLENGSLKGRFRLYNKDKDWNQELIDKLSPYFLDFDGKPLNKFSGNGGKYSVFVIPKKEIKDKIFNKEGVMENKVVNAASFWLTENEDMENEEIKEENDFHFSTEDSLLNGFSFQELIDTVIHNEKVRDVEAINKVFNEMIKYSVDNANEMLNSKIDKIKELIEKETENY